MKVFIVGKLGEVIKKVFELEECIRESPRNTVLLSELACYKQILSMWPVADKSMLDVCVYGFEMSLRKLKLLEKELRSSVDTVYLPVAVANYISALNSVRQAIVELNNIGKYIGPSPWMEIDYAEHT